MRAASPFVWLDELAAASADHALRLPAVTAGPLAMLVSVYAAWSETRKRADSLAQGRKSYQEFFALWKDANAKLPVLIEAKKEYGKLK